jgi:hypothetical protein
LQGRERLEIAIEIDSRSRVIVEGLVIGSSEPRFQRVDPKRFVRRIAQGEGDGGQDHVLAGHFCRSNEIDRTSALRFWPPLESEDSHNQSHDSETNQDDAGGRKIAPASSEFFANVKLRYRVDDQLRGRRGRRGRRYCLIGHRLIRPGLIRHAVIVDELCLAARPLRQRRYILVPGRKEVRPDKAFDLITVS